MSRLLLNSTMIWLIVSVNQVIATRLPLVAFEELIAKSDVVVVGRVMGSKIVDNDSDFGVVLVVSVDTKHFGSLGSPSNEIEVRVVGKFNPVRVGKVGLFFLQFDTDLGVYSESVPRMGVLERVHLFCGTDRDGGWESAYAIVRNGEFLTGVPENLLLDSTDCIVEPSNQSPLMRESKLTHLAEFL